MAGDNLIIKPNPKKLRKFFYSPLQFSADFAMEIKPT
jgi:virulence-associated protein VagC